MKNIKGSYITPDGKAQIDFEITHRNGYPEFTASGHFNGSCGQCIEEIKDAYWSTLPKGGFHFLITLWHESHLKRVCEDTVLKVSDLAEIYPFRDFYATQAETFLTRNGLTFRAVLKNMKAPGWDGPHGNHYRVTFSQGRQRRLTFDYWGSNNDREAGTHPTAYDVLSCVSGDLHTPETFEDFCAELGYDADSRKALATWKRCLTFSHRLKAFFTPEEHDQLSEIQ